MRFDSHLLSAFFTRCGILPSIICALVLGFAVSLSWQAQAQARTDDYLAKGQDFLRQGHYIQALDALEQALQAASTTEQLALASGFLGLTHYQLHHDLKAEALLRKALAFNQGSSHEQARWLGLLGSILLSQRQWEEAQGYFAKALALAKNDQVLRTGIELQQLALLPESERLAKLTASHQQLLPLLPSEARSSYLARIGAQARRLGSDGKKLAYEALMAAKVAAPPRLLAEILGDLAQLYEDDQRYEEAFRLNRNAMEALTGLEAPDLLIDLEWRQGRLQRLKGQIPEALADYQRAIGHIESIRHDLPLEYRDGRSSFRATLEPIYQQLTGLLLEQAKTKTNAMKVPLLRQARTVIELVKQAELEDFLGGRCAIQAKRDTLLEAVEPNTAIIYPIILPDRLELLVSTGNEIQQFTQAIDAKTLQKAAYKLVGALRGSQPEIKPLAETLYQYLIAPLENFLQDRQIQTLVIVPDSFLRLIPFAALFDGTAYLVERYAVSTSPGLSIISSSPQPPRRVKSLIVGLSEPGKVVEYLPQALISEIQSSDLRGLATGGTPRSRALNMPQTPDAERRIPNQPSPQDAKLNQKIKAALSLPGVVSEIASLSPSLPGTVLLNENFTVDRFREELLTEPYAIVHIASHLIAGPNAASSFIMAHDNVINFDQLDGILRSGKFAAQPVEMLTLSACQTAEGDDRAPLGLSGLAVKAKVRSALGSLWPVSDESTPLLMAEFYQALNQPGTTKAQALRQAQRTLLANKKLGHPFFWAPYILVGNWL